MEWMGRIKRARLPYSPLSLFNQGEIVEPVSMVDLDFGITELHGPRRKPYCGIVALPRASDGTGSGGHVRSRLASRGHRGPESREACNENLSGTATLWTAPVPS